jgi:hypothetical protein
LPTISVADLEIQRREGDLVIGTFGLGIYILDDLSPLRTPVASLSAGATLFKPRDSWISIPDSRRGWGGKGDYGIGRYAADNPPHGVVFSYFLAEDVFSLKEQRRQVEKEQAAKGEDNPYPAWDELSREDREEAPSIVLTVRNSSGRIIRRVAGETGKGFHRVAWDLRYPAPDPVNLEPVELKPWETLPQGALAVAGTYELALSKRVEGKLVDLAPPQSFILKPMFAGGLLASDQESRLGFQIEAAELYRAVTGAGRAADELQVRIDHVKNALAETPQDTEEFGRGLRALEARLRQLRQGLDGDVTRSSRYEPVPLSISGRIGFIISGSWGSQSAVSATHADSLKVAQAEFAVILAGMKSLAADLAALEASVEAIKAPWTPGRIPDYP